MSLLITGMIMAGGYFLKNGGNANGGEKEEKEKYANVYTSNTVNEVSNKMQRIADDRYADAKNPTFSGIGNPILYTMGQVGKDGFKTFGDSSKLGEVYEKNMLYDPRIGKEQEYKNARKELSPAVSNTYENFTPETNTSNISKYTGQVIEHAKDVLPFSKNDRSMVADTYVPGILDMAAGNRSTYLNKKEVRTFTGNGIPVPNVNVISIYEADQTRYHKSRFKRSEKPFEPIQIQTPKAWSSDDVSHEGFYKPIEELVVNPKQTYTGRIIQGQDESQNVRGILGSVSQNRQSTVSDKQYLVAESANFKSKKMDEDFYTNLKSTNRQGYNDEYSGPLSANIKQSDTRSGEWMESHKGEVEGDFLRNSSNMDRETGDYSKASISKTPTERNTYDAQPVINGNLVGRNPLVTFLDKAKSTTRETLDNIEPINEKTPFTKGGADVYAEGIVNIDPKTTIKEQSLFGYSGVVKGENRMGYLASEYHSKTTIKEQTLSEYSGILRGRDKMSYLASDYKSKATAREQTPIVDYVPVKSSAEFVQNNAIGDMTVSSNKALSEIEGGRRSVLSKLANFNQTLPTNVFSGKQTRLQPDSHENDRLDSELIRVQLQDNPFALNKLPKPI